MTTTKGGLNVKDYPFAFSIAALLFPSIFSPGNEVSSLIGITIIGGLVGTVLTIINPLGLIIRIIYIAFGMKKIFGFLQTSPLTESIIETNFRAAVPSPSISYETDKMVGMIYFILVLVLAMFRFTSQDFVGVIGLNEQQSFIALFGIISGIIFVGFVFYYDVIGFNRFGFRSISHLDRIKAVTALNLASDLTNLSNDGTKFCNTFFNHTMIIQIICEEMNRLYYSGIRGAAEFMKAIDRSTIDSELIKRGRKPEQISEDVLFDFFTTIEHQICHRYDIIFYQAIVWFLSPKFLTKDQMDTPSSLLQSSIDSRDWFNASLKTFRITEIINLLLNQKNMPEEFLNGVPKECILDSSFKN